MNVSKRHERDICSRTLPRFFARLNANGVYSNATPIARHVVWLRSTWDFLGTSEFSYSGDGKSFTRLGGACRLGWAHYRGDRIGLFTTATTEGGYVDVDAVRYHVTR